MSEGVAEGHVLKLSRSAYRSEFQFNSIPYNEDRAASRPGQVLCALGTGIVDVLLQTRPELQCLCLKLNDFCYCLMISADVFLKEAFVWFWLEKPSNQTKLPSGQNFDYRLIDDGVSFIHGWCLYLVGGRQLMPCLNVDQLVMARFWHCWDLPVNSITSCLIYATWWRTLGNEGDVKRLIYLSNSEKMQEGINFNLTV